MNIDFKDLEDRQETDYALDDFKHCIKKFTIVQELIKILRRKKLYDNWSEIVGLIKIQK